MSGVVLGSDIPGAYWPKTETKAPYGVIYVVAPNRSTIPVTHSEFRISSNVGAEWGDSDDWYIEDNRDIVSTSQNSVRDTHHKTKISDMKDWPHKFPYRALEGVDYSRYGFIKIGKIWVDPQNREDVEFANDLIRPTNEKVAKWVEDTGSWLIKPFDPENKRKNTTNEFSDDPFVQCGQKMDIAIAAKIEEGANYWKSFFKGA